MEKICKLFLVVFLFVNYNIQAQEDSVVKQIIEEATNNSQLEILAHELLDVIGPRLVGTPQMQQAHDWAVDTYSKWDISARNEQWGEWKSWERGISHIDMLEPRVQTLSGMQLAWSPSTKSKGVTAEVVTIPTVKDAEEFKRWMKTIKGKFVMTSMYQPTGRPDYNWEEFATEESFEKMKRERDTLTKEWRANISRT